jgi:hypothetical protein
MSCNFKEQSKRVRTGGIPLWWKVASSQAKPTPFPPRREIAHLTREKCASAMGGHDFYWRDWGSENGGGGTKRCKMVPFVNWSTNQRQNQDSQYHSAPFVILTSCAYLLRASFGKLRHFYSGRSL